MTILLALLACLGHLVLMIASHNWWYGRLEIKALGKVNHLVHGAVVALFPPALLLAYPDGLFAWSSDDPLRLLASLYLVVCLLAAVVLLPALTARRLLRMEPGPVTKARVVDVARLPGNQLFQIEFVERTLYLARLPEAWDGLTVLHISDLHFHGTPDQDYFRWVMMRAAEWQPDLLAITGDVHDSEAHVSWVRPVLGELRWTQGAFAILGNHDFWFDPEGVRRELGGLGIHSLGNGWTRTEVRGEPLVVIGQEQPWNREALDLTGCPTGAFRLCLGHTPDNIEWAKRNAIDLMLSGHVHGGQIRFPVFGSMLVPSRYGRRYDWGTFEEGPTLLHVSKGVSGEHVVRYHCRPEVVLLTLRRKR